MREILRERSERKGDRSKPEKIKAILDLPSPTTLKEVQQMVGKLIVVNRFISRSAERNLPFFKLFRKNKSFEWTAECEKSILRRKSLPILTTAVGKNPTRRRLVLIRGSRNRNHKQCPCARSRNTSHIILPCTC